MDKQRFIAFRTDLATLRDLVKGNQSPQYVEYIFSELVKKYPELAADPEGLPNLKVGPCTASSQKKSDADIKDELLRSIDMTRFMDYTGIKVVLDNEETCLDSLRSLEVAIKDSRKRIVYFSCLQGQVLKRLQDIMHQSFETPGPPPPRALAGHSLFMHVRASELPGPWGKSEW